MKKKFLRQVKKSKKNLLFQKISHFLSFYLIVLFNSTKKKVQYNRTYSNTSAGSSTSCSSCSNMSSPGIQTSGCPSCLPMMTSAPLPNMASSSTSSVGGTSQKKLKLSPVQDRLVLNSFTVAAANVSTSSAMDTSPVESILIDENDYSTPLITTTTTTTTTTSKRSQSQSQTSGGGGGGSNGSNSNGNAPTTPTTPLTPNSCLNVVSSFANRTTTWKPQQAQSQQQSTEASKENQEDTNSSVSLPTSMSLNSISSSTNNPSGTSTSSSSNVAASNIKSSSSSSSSKNSLCETMIEVS